MNTEHNKAQRDIPTASAILTDGRIIDLIYIPEENVTRLAEYKEGVTLVGDSLPLDARTNLVPISAHNNLIKHRAVLLPGMPEEYGDCESLRREIEEYLYRYVDLSDAFRSLASLYIMLTWVYDAFNELPYLRLRGDYGSGKTRALLVIGSLCHKGFFASGASTVSPIFHTLDTFKGTLILDEADFRFSDEKSELSKILNNGNVRGFPVLRTAITQKHEFDPRAFSVFGPKIIAMRNGFEDRALESRFITEEMGVCPLRSDIPLNLPDIYEKEAYELRSKLLQYRFSNLARITVNTSRGGEGLSARVSQILAPLFSLTSDADLHKRIQEAATLLERELRANQVATPEGELLEVLLDLFGHTAKDTVSVGEITAQYVARFGKEYRRPLTSRYVGYLLRKRLHLMPIKRHGVYVLGIAERSKIENLCKRYGIETGDGGRTSGDVG